MMMFITTFKHIYNVVVRKKIIFQNHFLRKLGPTAEIVSPCIIQVTRIIIYFTSSYTRRILYIRCRSAVADPLHMHIYNNNISTYIAALHTRYISVFFSIYLIPMQIYFLSFPYHIIRTVYTALFMIYTRTAPYRVLARICIYIRHERTRTTRVI